MSKLLKLLMLTQSSNDSEALSAIRMANKILAQSKRQWRDVLVDGLAPGDPDIGEKLDVVYEHIEFFNGYYQGLISQMYNDFRSGGKLGDKQIKTLDKMFDFIGKGVSST